MCEREYKSWPWSVSLHSAICQLGFTNYISSFIYWFKILSCCCFVFFLLISEIQPIFSLLFPSFLIFLFFFFLTFIPYFSKVSKFSFSKNYKDDNFFFLFLYCSSHLWLLVAKKLFLDLLTWSLKLPLLFLWMLFFNDGTAESSHQKTPPPYWLFGNDGAGVQLLP